MEQAGVAGWEFDFILRQLVVGCVGSSQLSQVGIRHWVSDFQYFLLLIFLPSLPSWILPWLSRPAKNNQNKLPKLPSCHNDVIRLHCLTNCPYYRLFALEWNGQNWAPRNLGQLSIFFSWLHRERHTMALTTQSRSKNNIIYSLRFRGTQLTWRDQMLIPPLVWELGSSLGVIFMSIFGSNRFSSAPCLIPCPHYLVFPSLFLSYPNIDYIW